MPNMWYCRPLQHCVVCRCVQHLVSGDSLKELASLDVQYAFASRGDHMWYARANKTKSLPYHYQCSWCRCTPGVLAGMAVEPKLSQSMTQHLISELGLLT
jgi:hypothetical protein